MQDNFGSLENKGFEIVLNGKPVASKNIQWEITGIFNHNRNKAINIGQAVNLLTTNAGAPVAIVQGQPIGVFYGTFFATDASGNLVKNAAGIPQIEKGVQNSALAYTPGRDGNGLPSGATLRRIIGNPNPDYTASLVNEVSYKKFGLRLQIDAVHGVDVFNADWRTRQGVGNGKVAEQEQRGQLPRGYVAGVYAIEQWRIDNGAYVKLRELSISYDFGKIKSISNLSVSFSGRNLISWDNYKGYDPEVNTDRTSGDGVISSGIDYLSYPKARSIIFGLNLSF